MPIEHIILNIPDKPLKDLFTWLPRDGGKEEFPLLDAATESERIVCTHPSNPSILNTMVAMIENAQDKVSCNWMLIRRSRRRWSEQRSIERPSPCLTTLETSVHSRYTGDEEALNDLGRLQKLAGEGVYTVTQKRMQIPHRR